MLRGDGKPDIVSLHSGFSNHIIQVFLHQFVTNNIIPIMASHLPDLV
jgi:hypothetical protein